MSHEQRRHNLAGIAWMCAGVGIFSFMDAAMKDLSTRYPALEVGALRGAVSLPVITLWIAVRGGFQQVVRVLWPLHALRGVVGGIARRLRVRDPCPAARRGVFD